MRCACDACMFELNEAEAASPDKLCGFCDDRCFPRATLNGVPKRMTLTRDSRVTLHRETFENPAKAKARDAMMGLVDIAKPYAKEASRLGFEFLLETFKNKITKPR